MTSRSVGAAYEKFKVVRNRVRLRHINVKLFALKTQVCSNTKFFVVTERKVNIYETLVYVREDYSC
jgi:hypothetical protein